jgi:hypothetical protein
MGIEFRTDLEQDATFKKIGQDGLHGDVIIRKTKFGKDFDRLERVQDACLAYGELTGHSHKIFGNPEDFDLRQDPVTKERHLRVVKPVMLRHQEHTPVKLPPGDYKIGIQREYDPFSKLVRQVAD